MRTRHWMTLAVCAVPFSWMLASGTGCNAILGNDSVSLPVGEVSDSGEDATTKLDSSRPRADARRDSRTGDVAKGQDASGPETATVDASHDHAEDVKSGSDVTRPDAPPAVHDAGRDAAHDTGTACSCSAPSACRIGAVCVSSMCEYEYAQLGTVCDGGYCTDGGICLSCSMAPTCAPSVCHEAASCSPTNCMVNPVPDSTPCDGGTCMGGACNKP
jgi:hypothetical protein